MSRGKYLSLEEARKSGGINRFCKGHETTGDKKEFGRILDNMIQPIKKPKPADQTSKKG